MTPFRYLGEDKNVFLCLSIFYRNSTKENKRQTFFRGFCSCSKRARSEYHVDPVVVVYYVTIVAIGVELLKKFRPLGIGCFPCNHCSNLSWVAEEILAFDDRLFSTHCRVHCKCTCIHTIPIQACNDETQGPGIPM